HEGLQDMTLDRQPQPGQPCNSRGVAGHRKANASCLDCAACGLHAHDAITRAYESGDLAVLNDIDSQSAGCPGVAPNHGIVPGRTSTSLQQAAANGESRILVIEEWEHPPDARGVEQFSVDAVHQHGVAASCVSIALRIRVVEVQNATLTDH